MASCFNCKADVGSGDDEYCHGCKKHVCEKCEVNWNMPFGEHAPEVHLEEAEDEG